MCSADAGRGEGPREATALRRQRRRYVRVRNFVPVADEPGAIIRPVLPESRVKPGPNRRSRLRASSPGQPVLWSRLRVLNCWRCGQTFSPRFFLDIIAIRIISYVREQFQRQTELR